MLDTPSQSEEDLRDETIAEDLKKGTPYKDVMRKYSINPRRMAAVRTKFGLVLPKVKKANPRKAKITSLSNVSIAAEIKVEPGQFTVGDITVKSLDEAVSLFNLLNHLCDQVFGQRIEIP